MIGASSDPCLDGTAALASPLRARGDVRTVVLATPPPACIVPEGVFDAFGWCDSRDLVWRRPAGRWDQGTPIDGSDPARMVFVVHDVAAERAAFLPSELACLHAFGLGLEAERALAPWAIDDATDLLFEQRVEPRTVLWLAADNVNALFWGLHDWAHFHNHGPFTERAWTELQCDGAALAWLWMNRDRVPMGAATWEEVRRQVEAVSRRRFEAEGLSFGEEALASARLRDLCRP